MTSHLRYREDAAAVRRAARAKLAEFRSARVKRRASIGLSVLPAFPEAEPKNSNISPQYFLGSIGAQKGEVESADDIFGVQVALDSGQDVDVKPHQVDSDADSKEQVPDFGGEDVLQHSTEADDLAGSELSEGNLSESDLFELPSVGPGMVWLFHECGIDTLAQLSVANAQDLALKLGVVGQIVNMEPWIKFAREYQKEKPERLA